jgi:hypothetical protein
MNNLKTQLKNLTTTSHSVNQTPSQLGASGPVQNVREIALMRYQTRVVKKLP